MKIIDLNDYKNIESRGNCQNLFNSYNWLNVINKTYGFHFKAIVSNDSRFFLPFCLLEDEYFSSIKSVPFGDYTLINCSKKELYDALQLLKNTFPKCYIETSIVIKSATLVDNFTSSMYGFLIQVDIKKWKESRDWQETYERNIRNALKYGLSVRINKTVDGIKNFYLLHEKLRINKFKKMPQPFRFFENIYQDFVTNGKGFILETWHREKLVASWFILIHGQVLYYKFGASDSDYLQLRPNDLLFRSLMQYGSDNGFKTIDLGFSGATKSYEGLIRFKSKEGGVKTPIYRIERYPDGFDKSLLHKKNDYLSNISKKAIASGQISVIRETSNNYYGKFA